MHHRFLCQLKACRKIGMLMKGKIDALFGIRSQKKQREILTSSFTETADSFILPVLRAPNETTINPVAAYRALPEIPLSFPPVSRILPQRQQILSDSHTPCFCVRKGALKSQPMPKNIIFRLRCIQNREPHVSQTPLHLLTPPPISWILPCPH